MKIRIAMLITLLALFGLVAFAADVTGKWTAEVPGRGGQPQTQTFTFKAEGDKLTGTVSGMQGETPFTDGKIAGDEISFIVVREIQGNKIKTTYKGTVSAGEIKFTMIREGGQGGGQPREFVAKRAVS